jgi:hypothetical protein
MHRTRSRWRRPLLRQEGLEERLALSAAPPAVLDIAVASSSWSSAFYQHLEDEALGDGGGYSIPTGANLQDDSLPWLAIDRVRIKFSEDVFIDASDLSVTGVSQSVYEIAGFSYDPVSDVAEWVFAEPFENDRILLDLDAGGDDPVRDLLGNRLDGEWTNWVSDGPSGNSVAGGDFAFRINVLRGDAVNYGTVQSTSLWAVYLSTGLDTEDAGYVPQYDLDGDGLIEATDWQFIYGHQSNTLPSGVPLGIGDNAPTTSHFSRVQIGNDAIDVAISLWDAFDDVEDSDDELTYAIESVGDPGLFDSYSINSTTGQLIVNTFTSTTISVSGRTAMQVSATDSSGQTVRSTITFDVHRSNSSTSLTAQATQGSQYVWCVSGTVADSDDDVDDLWILLSGPIVVLVPVHSDGTFSYSFEYDEPYASDVWLLVHHPEEEPTLPLNLIVGW